MAIRHADEEGASSSWTGIALRFWLPSILAVLILAGGVIWLRSLPSGATSANSGGAIQVRLLQTPEPTPIALQPPSAHPLQSSGRQPEQRPELVEPILAELPPTPQAASASAPDQIATPDMEAVEHPFSEPPNAAIAQFQRTLMQHIAKFQRYPGGLTRDHLEGIVQIAFVMGRDGKIVDAWVKTSSGQVVLDRAAVDALRRAEPLPTIPNGLPDQLSVLAPISFAAQ